MKAGYLLSSLGLAPLALAAPLIQTSVLITSTSTRTLVLESNIQPVLKDTGNDRAAAAAVAAAALDSTTREDAPSASLDSERPLTTAELMALSIGATPGPDSSREAAAAAEAQAPAPARGPRRGSKAAKGKVSVGTLVIPDAGPGQRLAKLLELQSGKPYLVPGYYISSQRADVLVVGMILAFVLIVLAVETWSLVTSFITRAFSGRGSIYLDDEDDGLVDLEDCELDEDDEAMDLAPFGGYSRRDLEKSLRLPEKLDEKAGWI